MYPAGLAVGSNSGTITISALGATAQTVAVTLNITAAPQLAASPSLFDLSGAMSSACFGGNVTVDTPTPLAVPSDELCPTAGVLDVTGTGGMARITYASDGKVTIDQGGMEAAYLNCLDPQLLMCLA